ncbi:hypothetical protein [Novosphingobium humi]|uniref:Uncharacterized protein n=1 Tax=Novosphingobium humi TaxID=2282397 RepID=A0ABY7TTS6_9SPHN|nr:hypothetical protein [Novosphingobium humi]WCT76633.1 hypothetical protein PQ457_11885 [Novosphingobium humi]
MRHIAAENRRIGLIFWALRPWGGRIVEKQNPARKAHGAMKPHESAHFAPTGRTVDAGQTCIPMLGLLLRRVKKTRLTSARRGDN